MKIVLEENQLNYDMTEEIEYLIDNNLFFENIQVHTCPILKEHIIEYKIKNKYILIELVENTFNRYFNDLKEGKRLYEITPQGLNLHFL
ncbi:MAG: hypothetical protein C0625_07480 [Arcobacter sp.]|nr:MAG: hypothetical protein C0625_07480 [Arcobacter sp.]